MWPSIGKSAVVVVGMLPIEAGSWFAVAAAGKFAAAADCSVHTLESRR